MAELNFKQITDKLNEEFKCDLRKLIFWYDENAEFQEDVDSLELNNAKVLHLDKDNQFQTKYFLERQDTTTNYLIYAPFPKPSVRENHLSDTIRYSKEFFADRSSLLCIDLGISEKNKQVIQNHISFFNNKERINSFYALEIDDYSASSIEIGMMSILCKSKIASFEDVVRIIITEKSKNENKYLEEFAKFNLKESFWNYCDTILGYSDSEPSIEKLVICLFITYISKSIHSDIPENWKKLSSYKSGNVVAFLDNMMNSVLYADNYDEIAAMIYKTLKCSEFFSSLNPEDLIDCAVFKEADNIIIKWIVERLVAEDVEAKLCEKSIVDICEFRRKMHFGNIYSDCYLALENAFYIITNGSYSPVSGLNNIAKKYIEKDCLLDRSYRYFYYYFDKLDNNSDFDCLRELVENIYTNSFLNNITVNWSRNFVLENGKTNLDNQLDFFSKYVQYKKERVVVIISDALRYEVGLTLFEKLRDSERCDVKMSSMQSVIPSITSFCMAALLPHKNIFIDNNHKVFCDEKSCADLTQRESILKLYKENSCCVQYDDIKSMKSNDFKSLTAGKDVIYVYHNQIDARGDKLSTENEVFTACEEAVEEIVKLIRNFTTKGNVLHFIVTADHGFLYKRDKLTESDKISGISNSGKRYAIVDSKYPLDGVSFIPMNAYMRKEEEYRYVLSPLGSDVFKTSGSGMNYVHGGCSPQEIIIPVIEVKTDKSRVETSNATIDIISLTNKITNLNVIFNFIQNEAVSDTVKETVYRICFVDENGNNISNENIYHADNKENEAQKRVFKMKFSFKNQLYDKQKKYYLVAVDEKNNLEIIRREVIMDIAFSGDFGFGN